MEGKEFLILCGWDQRQKGDHSRFSATKLEMRLGELDLEEEKEWGVRRRRSVGYTEVGDREGCHRYTTAELVVRLRD